MEFPPEAKSVSRLPAGPRVQSAPMYCWYTVSTRYPPFLLAPLSKLTGSAANRYVRVPPYFGVLAAGVVVALVIVVLAGREEVACVDEVVAVVVVAVPQEANSRATETSKDKTHNTTFAVMFLPSLVIIAVSLGVPQSGMCENLSHAVLTCQHHDWA